MPTMDQLADEQNAAQKKLILGIIFSAIAFFFLFMGIALVSYEPAFSLLILFSLPCFGIGTPFLIIGIVKTISAKRAIALAKNAPVNTSAAQAYTQPTPQPVPAQPQPVYQQQAYQQQAYQQQAYQQQTYQQPSSFVPLDWKKYNPLHAGVSMKPDKDYKFHRADGFVGSVPQKFVDRTFPRCPICCSNQPHWTIAQHNQMAWKGNLYLFKCSTCDSVISMSMPDVTTLGNGAGGIASNLNVGLTNLMVKASAGKKVGAVYAVIESVGRSGVSRECEGKEFELEHLQDMFLRQ